MEEVTAELLDRAEAAEAKLQQRSAYNPQQQQHNFRHVYTQLLLALCSSVCI